MRRVVIDTNVLIVANCKSPEADTACELEAGRLLERVRREKVVLVDTADLVINEYKTYCSFSGQPGLGDLFFSELIRNIANADRVRKVDIGSTEDEIRTNVPESLHDFHNDDWKWIALLKRGGGEAIYNATDSDYRIAAAKLAAEGVDVVELCPHCLKKSGTQ